MPDEHSEHTNDAKDRQLQAERVDTAGARLTTNQGLAIDHTDDALSVGERGPTLLEDFHTREKITHFDHERIPERVVHARGAGAYGHFRPYGDWLSEYTAARFLTDPSVETPLFVRFSTVAGNRGSADTVRDVRGFATKFYTEQGNYDLVANNFPVFFIQDGVKFPDFVHAVKPEPHNEIPQAQSAHDTLWDFVGKQAETLHTIMWLMSDRSLPRSYRMMQGFGVHTFRFVAPNGQGTFVKFHWKPILGSHSLVWDECQKIAGKDPDFNRRDLWESIEAGLYPEYELGVQLVSESDEFAFDFDLLDPTKIIPEEEVPVRAVGRMVLNRNPDNFFAETEQVAFHTAHVVPGIDFTNDPLLQARNFSYLDTQLIRLGGPNFAQIPVNRPVAPVHNNQRDGFQQHWIHPGRSTYEKNTLGGGCPVVGGEFPEVFKHYQEKVEGGKIRKRAESFQDHYSQATLFWNSMTEWEQEHIVAAFRFELGKCDFMEVRERAVGQLNLVDHELARAVAEGIGVTPPEHEERPNHGRTSPALSLTNQLAVDGPTVLTRQIAVLVADGVDGASTSALLRTLRQRGAQPELLAVRDGTVRCADGTPLEVDRAINTTASVVYDAVLVPGGEQSVQLLSSDGYAKHFVTEAVKHAKAVGATGEGVRLLRNVVEGIVRVASDEEGDGLVNDRGVVSSTRADENALRAFCDAFCETVARHRAWERDTSTLPA